MKTLEPLTAEAIPSSVTGLCARVRRIASAVFFSSAGSLEGPEFWAVLRAGFAGLHFLPQRSQVLRDAVLRKYQNPKAQSGSRSFLWRP